MIKCEEICVFEESFKRSISDEKKNINMPVKIDTNYFHNIDKKKNDAKLELTVVAGEENAEYYSFYYRIKMAGIFSWYDSDASAEGAEKEVRSDGAKILYSFIRTYLYDALKKAGMESIVLPVIDL